VFGEPVLPREYRGEDIELLYSRCRDAEHGVGDVAVKGFELKTTGLFTNLPQIRLLAPPATRRRSSRVCPTGPKGPRLQRFSTTTGSGILLAADGRRPLLNPPIILTRIAIPRGNCALQAAQVQWQ
jgi:hypothetical protein